MQHEVTRIQKLLDRNGHIGEPGWARKPVWQYCRWDVKAPPLKIKEWDYYMVLNKDFGVAVTFSDLGYMGMACLTFLDFVNCKEHTETVITPCPEGGLSCNPFSPGGAMELQPWGICGSDTPFSRGASDSV